MRPAAQRPDPSRAVQRRHCPELPRALAAHLLGLTPQGTLRALSQTCRQWSSDTLALAPRASRTLTLVASWPAALRAAAGLEGEGRSREEELRARRDRLLESIRMGCQDPQLAGGPRPEAPEGERDAPGRAVEPASECVELDWFRHGSLRDRELDDEQLHLALRQAAPGDISRICICSSRLSDDSAVAQKLGVHASALTHICLRNCGEGGLSGRALAGVVLRRARPALRALALVDVPRVPLEALASRCALRSLLLRGTLSASGVEALSRCPSLEVLRLPLREKVPEAPFIRVFSCCRSLRVVDIHGATDVSDQILACIMLHNTCLEDFAASHAASGFAQCLSAPMAQAFRAHFSAARRIRIDDLTRDSEL